MKYHESRWLISLIVLFSIGSSQLFGQESQTVFDFPMEVGDKWIYLEWGFPICSGQGGFGQRCIYAKLEVVGAEELNQRKCGRFQYDTYVVDSFEMGDTGLIFKTDGVTFNSSVDIHLCQDENRLYWLHEPADLSAELTDSLMIADFDRDESQPWVIQNSDGIIILRRLLEKSEHPPKTYYFESYLADDVDDLNGGFGFEFVFSRPGALTDGVGFHMFGYEPSPLALRSHYVNGVAHGDTTFLYQPTSIEHRTSLPTTIEVTSFPNPFNPTTTIMYTLPESSQLDVRLLDVQGRVVKGMFTGVQSAGSHRLEVNASNLASGVYFVELRTGDAFQIHKISLVK